MRSFGIGLLIIVLAVLVAGLSPTASQAYVGMLSSATGGILGTGNWVLGGTTAMEWTVTQNQDLTWHYDYLLSHPDGETSHILLEVSPTFGLDNLLNPGGDFGEILLQTWTDQEGNPNLPDILYGIKFNETSGTATHIYFDSDRAPMWGDFYAKDGNSGGQGVNTAWNAGFTLPDSDPITVPPHDGSEMNHILVPDTQVNPIPEPMTLLLLSGGLLAGALAHRRRRA